MIATLEEAFAYFANRLRSDAWNAAPDAEKDQALTQADALLTACVEWRDGAFTVGSDGAKTFASQVKFALFEEALYLLKVDPTEYPELLTLGVQSASGSTFNRAFVAPLLAPVAVRLLGTLGTVVVDDERGGSIRAASLGY